MRAILFSLAVLLPLSAGRGAGVAPLAGPTPLAHTLHADVANWYTRLRAAGGNASDATLLAADTFATAIATASIRDKFYRLNFFAGDDLTAALVPFYLGPTTGGTEYGYTVDQNNGPFTSGDWSLTTGLTGNGSSKYLDTNLAPSTVGSSVGHLAVDRLSAVASNTRWMGSWITSPGTSRLDLSRDGGNVGFKWAGTIVAAATGDPGAGFYMGSRPAANNRKLYLNGSEVGSNGASTTSDHIDQAIVVFANRSAGTVGSFTAETFGGYSIGLPMDATQAGAYNTAWAALRTALGR